MTWLNQFVALVVSASAFLSFRCVQAAESELNVAAWGYHATLTNVPSNLTNALAVSTLAGHTLALTAGGQVVAWGFDNSGDVSVPVGLTNVCQVAAGGHHSLALTADGFVVAWGDNIQGQTNVPSGLSKVAKQHLLK